MHEEVLYDRAEGERRKVSQGAHDDDGTDQQAHEERPVRGQSPARNRDFPLGSEAAGHGQHRYDKQEPADQCGESEGEVEPGSVSTEAPEGTSVVTIGTRISIENLAQSVRTVVGQIRNGRARGIPV